MCVTTKVSCHKVVSAMLYLAGNTIGAGVLALPVMVGLTGLLPAVIGIFLMWALMLFSGLALVEKNVLHKDSVDFVSLYKREFGKIGKYTMIIGYLFLFYGLSVAYLSGATTTILDLCPPSVPYLGVLLTLFFGLAFFILRGSEIVIKGNALLMTVLLICFSLLIFRSTSFLHFSNFSESIGYTDWAFFPLTLPVVLCSYGFHNTLPIVAKSLNGNVKKIRLAVILGSTLPLIFNILILLMTIGTLPMIGSENSLLTAFKEGLPVTIPLGRMLHSDFFRLLGFGFSILAIFTSYIAVAMGLLGFVSDFTSSWHHRNKIITLFLTFGIPLVITLIGKNLFLRAIGFGAGIGAVIIFGIMPTLMKWKTSSIKGKIISSVVLSLFLFVLIVEAAQQIGLIKIFPKIDV